MNKSDSNKISEKSIYSRIFPAIGMTLGIMAMFGSPLSLIFLFTGSFSTKIFLIAILIYQYFFAKKSDVVRQFLLFFRVKDYFDEYKIHYEDINSVSKTNSLFVCHPHGISGVGFAILQGYCEVLYECSTGLVSTVILMLPISGLVAKWMGAQSVKQSNFEKLMENNQNICFLPGGFEEATITHSNQDRVFIKNRKGFIKIALKYGYELHPVYTFGERKLYKTMNFLESFRLYINKFKIPTAMFFGILFLPFYHVRLITVIGKKLCLPKIENPTEEEVNLHHQNYVNCLVDLYDKYKNEFDGSPELKIY